MEARIRNTRRSRLVLPTRIASAALLGGLLISPRAVDAQTSWGRLKALYRGSVEHADSANIIRRSPTPAAATAYRGTFYLYRGSSVRVSLSPGEYVYVYYAPCAAGNSTLRLQGPWSDRPIGVLPAYSYTGCACSAAGPWYGWGGGWNVVGTSTKNLWAGSAQVNFRFRVENPYVWPLPSGHGQTVTLSIL